MTMRRIRSVWEGIEGSPGYTVMFWEDVDGGLAAVHTFFSSIATIIPTGVSVKVEQFGDKVDEATGMILGGWAEPDLAAVGGAGDPKYAGPVGLAVRWYTGEVVAGHRVTGKTYIVPTPANIFMAGGQGDSGSHNTLQNAATTLVNYPTPGLLVWARPKAAQVAPKRPHPARSGTKHAVNSGTAQTKAAVMSSRRD